MGLVRFNYRSVELGYYVNITVTLPTDGVDYRKDLPEGMKLQTIYLIHGGGDDDTLPYRYTNIERYAQQAKVMTVTPGIPNSFGADAKYGVKYMTFLTQELPRVIQSYFASSSRREDNFVMGFAMGGNVALAMAIMHPESYAACVDMSGGIGFTLSTDTMIRELEGDHFRDRFYRYIATFGEGKDFAGSVNDLFPIAKRMKEEGRELCDITMLCGAKEFIRARVEEDVRILRELGYPVTYHCPEGFDHNYDTWEHFMPVTLNEWLPLKRNFV